MASARELPEAIQWHEGMLLAPQHFQQSLLRQEELLHYHLMAIAPFHWGIRRLKIDEALLVNGTFRVTDLEAIMPDGLVIYHPSPGGEDLEVDLSPYVDEMKQRQITAYLTVPARKLGQPPMKGDLPRFSSVEGEPVVDENTGEGEIPIPRLRPLIGLLVGEKPPQKYVAFPLAKIHYIYETITMSNYVPPTLSISVKSPIGEICLEIANRLRLKAIFLSEKMMSPSAVMKGPMVLETKSMIHSLVAGLPRFEAVLNTDQSHPYLLYLSLCSLVGQAASLGRGLLPPVLDPYDHNDILSSFDQAKGFINKMIEEGILVSHSPVPFDFENGVFSLTLDPTWITPALIIGTRARPGMTEEDVTAWMEESLIGSRTKTETMKEKRILGAPRKRIDAEGELVPTRGACLFSVKVDPAFIEPNEPLDIFNTSDPAGQKGPGEVVLYVRNRP
ncbi:MAG: type VI secretion system baseplate subunit TssK [Pseudomonadota bacterium]